MRESLQHDILSAEEERVLGRRIQKLKRYERTLKTVQLQELSKVEPLTLSDDGATAKSRRRRRGDSQDLWFNPVRSYKFKSSRGEPITPWIILFCSGVPLN